LPHCWSILSSPFAVHRFQREQPRRRPPGPFQEGNACLFVQWQTLSQ
jgi:hypothetical protein